jgi:hypothetical protein
MIAYLDEMEIPRPMIDAMFATGSAEIQWVDYYKVERPPSLSEWEDAGCGSQSQEEADTKSSLLGRDIAVT